MIQLSDTSTTVHVVPACPAAPTRLSFTSQRPVFFLDTLGKIRVHWCGGLFVVSPGAAHPRLSG